MTIGLIDVDGHNWPNLALMKLSAWDYMAESDAVLRGLRRYVEHGKKNRHGKFGSVYVLTNYDTSMEENLYRMGDTPVQVPSQRGNGKDYAATVKDVEKMVPTKVSDLTNDSGFQTSSEVSAAISAAISQSGHAVFEKVDAIPDAAGAQSNILYLVMNSKTKHYDIYAKVGEEVVRLDDTTVDLSGYVEKEEGKVLSSNDFTDELKAKLEAGPEAATDAEVAEMLAEVFGAAS